MNVLLSFFISGGNIAKHLGVYDPVLPWVTVCLVGILFGKLFIIFRDRPQQIYKSLFWAFVTLWVAFVVLRVLGLAGVTKFGNFRLPHHSGTEQYFNAFFTLSKYPSSFSSYSFSFSFLSLFFEVSWIPTINRIPLFIFGRKHVDTLFDPLH